MSLYHDGFRPFGQAAILPPRGDSEAKVYFSGSIFLYSI